MDMEWDEKKSEDIDVNSMLNLNNHTMCNYGDPDPFMNVIYIDDERLYVCLFHNGDMMHWHFFYDLNMKCMIGNPVSYKLDCSKKNYPVRSFYNG